MNAVKLIFARDAFPCLIVIGACGVSFVEDRVTYEGQLPAAATVLKVMLGYLAV